ncbi:hypothetical protein IU443_02975 [Nocardia farcinica]|uniref:Uncharacterized protein n=1 Tax=Nocardia farcinica (strain IFM 10152) TaxID=247156 RepID=Q5YW69_NOCFA|nr:MULTISPECIES: hypothetical protein [Nocardia]AXK84809.1 hypothetical protein DXT66_03370 [Nocardia farcinica]MBA4854495.1 hypothetical protein [Nocardia farcinica]MBC9814680.1 hypothetical protein [Nocardia farcinica]MBF6067438.1 hypothetical protein [Nocardia farcinica]MBF6139851.1 hypothetical protein [Nocardia farcinica]
MSFEYVVVPVGAVRTPGEIPDYLRSQAGRPLDDDLRLVVVAGLRAWNSAVSGSRPHAGVRIEAAGYAVRVTAADRGGPRVPGALDNAAAPVRQLLEDLITGFDYELYDARSYTVSRAPEHRVVEVDIGGEQRFSSMTERQIHGWIPNLDTLAATPFLIAGKPHDDQTFIQTYRNSAVDYTLEVHHSGRPDHYFATTLSDPALVARLIWEWAGDDWSTLERVDWLRESK